MSNELRFDSHKAYEPVLKTATDQENMTRLLLWDRIRKSAATDNDFRRLISENPEQAVQKVASSLQDSTGNKVDVSRDVVKTITEDVKKTFSTALPQIDPIKVEALIFGTIEDIRRSYKVTLLLSQVLFYFGLVLVAVAFIAAIWSGKEMISLIFGGGGLASILISSLVMSPLDRVRDAAGDLVQLQMAYLAYYKQMCLLGGDITKISKADAIEYCHELERGVISLMSSIQSNVEIDKSKTASLKKEEGETSKSS